MITLKDINHTLKPNKYYLCLCVTSLSLCTSSIFAEQQTLATLSFKATEDSGTAEQGYKTNQVSNIGPWQGRKLQDLPYSIQVYSQDLIKNVQANSSTDEIYRMNPLMQLHTPQYANDQPMVFLRGFRVATSFRDGLLGDQFGHGTTIEDTEKVEFFNGLSGFLYGPANVGGLTNFISKRSTIEPLNEITLGSTGGKNWYIGGDFSGKFDEENKFGYRLNALKQDGETQIKNQNIDKKFISLALDWQPTDQLSLQIDAMYRDFNIDGKSADWDFSGKNVQRISAKSLRNDMSWSQDWTNSEYKTERYGAHLNWQANDQLTLRMNYLESQSDRATQLGVNRVNADGTYNQTIPRIYANGMNRRTSQQFDKRTSTYLDYQFNTASIVHKLTFGYQTTNTTQKRFKKDAKEIIYENLNTSSPNYFPKPEGEMLNRGDYKSSADTKTESWLVGDDVTFNDQWSALIGGAYVKIKNKLKETEQSTFTPNLSLIYKPQDNITTYATYIESLENGGIAPDTSGSHVVINAGQQFDPIKSKQIELGLKYDFNDQLALNTAIFKIDKALEYSQNIDDTHAIYVQNGRQIHQGIEFTATGKLTDRVSIVGGYTYLDPKIKQQKNKPELEGKRPPIVAKEMFKVYAEYDLPQIENLSVNAGVTYTGKSFTDKENTDVLPAYTLFNIGARYQTQLKDVPVTLRANLNNAFNKHYWANDINLGEPRTLLFSSSFKF